MSSGLVICVCERRNRLSLPFLRDAPIRPMTALATFDHVLYVPNFLQRDYFVVPEESPEPP